MFLSSAEIIALSMNRPNQVSLSRSAPEWYCADGSRAEAASPGVADALPVFRRVCKAQVQFSCLIRSKNASPAFSDVSNLDDVSA
jgi:hypothetical protein